MVTAINKDDGNGNLNPSTQLTAYKYDQLNRLSSMGTYLDFDRELNQWNPGAISTNSRYNTNYTYDANGNIHNLKRNNSSQLVMDNLSYTYDWIDAGDHSKGKNRNKLLSVEDATGAPINSNDFGNSSDYTYDRIGNLITDSGEEIAEIEWTVSGKVKRVTRDAGSAKPDLEFTYDPMGNRVMKKVINSSGTTITYYVRDAQGNVLTTYKEDDNNDIYLQDFAIYGSSRLGILNINKKVIDLPNIIDNTNPVQTKIGIKYFELTNHLGNVLTTISDRKQEVEDGTSGTIAYYTADIISSSDYYPFGFAMDGRDYSSDEYRFGFNGKEKDDEFTNSTSHYDFGARIYDSRIGRWLAVDPLAAKYPDLSVYHFTGNNPIIFIDVDGRKFVTYIKAKNETTGKTETQKVTFDGVTTMVQTFHKGELIGKATVYKGGDDFVDNIVASYNYIVENDADVDGAMKEMATMQQELVINNKRNRGEYDPESKEVNYDFSKGLKIDSKDGSIDGAQSPALGFWSEVYHAYIDQVDTETKESFNGDILKEEEYVHVEKEGQVIDALKEAKPDSKETKRSTYGDGWKKIKTKGVTNAEEK